MTSTKSKTKIPSLEKIINALESKKVKAGTTYYNVDTGKINSDSEANRAKFVFGEFINGDNVVRLAWKSDSDLIDRFIDEWELEKVLEFPSKEKVIKSLDSKKGKVNGIAYYNVDTKKIHGDSETMKAKYEFRILEKGKLRVANIAGSDKLEKALEEWNVKKPEIKAPEKSAKVEEQSTDKPPEKDKPLEKEDKPLEKKKVQFAPDIVFKDEWKWEEHINGFDILSLEVNVSERKRGDAIVNIGRLKDTL
jgi:hypothetical protein